MVRWMSVSWSITRSVSLCAYPPNSILLSSSTRLSDKDEEIRRLAQGRLLSELAARMNHKATEGGADPLKLAIHGCHDTSLAGMAQTLDVFDGR